MATFRPKVLIACDERVRNSYLPSEEIERLETFADWDWFSCEGGSIYTTNENLEAAAELSEHLSEISAMVVCHGCPTITPEVLEAAPNLKIIGELEGDRFASRIDLEAAWERGIRTVDTTNGSSYPVSEWALGLILIALRNAGAQFRRIIAGETTRDNSALEYAGGLLTGKRVGLIGGRKYGQAPYQIPPSLRGRYLGA